MAIAYKLYPMTRLRILTLASLAAIALSSSARAQQPYALHEMNFDLWCQEEKHLPPDRCDKRLPQDDAEFQAYRSTIEKYEIPYLQKKQSDENLNTVIIHHDPVDHPAQLSVPQNSGGTLPCSGAITCGLQPSTPQNPGGTSAPQQ